MTYTRLARAMQDEGPSIDWMDADGGFNHALDLIDTFAALERKGWRFVPPPPDEEASVRP